MSRRSMATKGYATETGTLAAFGSRTYGPTDRRRAGPALGARKGPPFAARAAAGRQRVDEHERRRGLQRERQTLRVRRALEAHDRIGEHREQRALADARLELHPRRAAIDLRRSLRGEQRARVVVDDDLDRDDVTVDESAAKAAGIGPARHAVVLRREQPQRALG